MRYLLPCVAVWCACSPDDGPPTSGATYTATYTDTDTDTDTTVDTDTTTTVPELCEGDAPAVTTLFTTRRTGLVNTVDLTVALDGEAAMAVACTRADNPEEVLFYSALTATDHVIPLRGLAADSTYTCKLVSTCPESAAPEEFQVTTLPLPGEIPTVAVSTPGPAVTTAPPFLLLGHDRHCAGDTARLLMFDLNGEIRWYYEGVPDIDIAYESQYLGDGLFSWGGGYYDGAPPELVDVDHNVQYVVDTPVSQSHVFHHDGRQLANGDILLMMIEGVSDGTIGWDGFSIGLVDPITNTDTWFYTSQTAVDAGDLPSGYGDPWHANWADYQEDPVNGDRLYVSLCNLGDIIAIDATTKQLLWTFGDTGDFTVQYPDGSPVPADRAYTQCQHGLEFVPFAGGGGGNLLVYDNGSHGRGLSRLAEFELDETTKIATLLWGWTEPQWMEPSWGDVDYLPNDHVLGTMGHACWSPFGNDVSSVVELEPATAEIAWRLDFLDPVDAIYRSERVDACDVFPISGFCPSVDVSLAALAFLFDPCGPGGTDVDQDGDGAFLCADLDCDDGDPAAYPGGTETCDGVDNNCDGVRDEGFPGTDWFVDQDGDGAGGDVTIVACAQPAGTTAYDGDCDDAEPDAWPGNPELCDAIDNDCNGRVDELAACWSCTASGSLLSCGVALPWLEASEVCVDLGGDLVTIDDATENDEVAALAGGQAWIGFNDLTAEGVFTWIDGSTSTYTSWYGGEPNDWGGNEDCAGTNFGETGTWNDYTCTSVQLPFVCEL